MNAGGILFTSACIVIGASLIVAVLLRCWPRYGSVEAAVSRTDEVLEQMEHATSEH
jgi:hypothetical protein